MTVLFGGVFAGMSIVWDRRIGYVERLLAAPISQAAIPLGKMLAAAVQGGFRRAVRHRVPWRRVRPPCGHGLQPDLERLFLGPHLKSPETLVAVVNFFTLPLMFTSNALFPPEARSSWLAAVAQLNPVTHAVPPFARSSPSVGIGRPSACP